MQIVPGQMEGEKRKDEAAVSRAPAARPDFCFERKMEGEAKRARPAVAAMESVEKAIEERVTGGERDRKMDAPIVRRDRSAPAYKVVAMAEGEPARKDEEALLKGKGGGSTVRDTAMAR